MNCSESFLTWFELGCLPANRFTGFIAKYHRVPLFKIKISTIEKGWRVERIRVKREVLQITGKLGSFGNQLWDQGWPDIAPDAMAKSVSTSISLGQSSVTLINKLVVRLETRLAIVTWNKDALNTVDQWITCYCSTKGPNLGYCTKPK